MELISLLAKEFGLRPTQVENTIKLLDEDNTIPFIARYRKEATGDLDEVVIRDIRDRALYLRELEERRATVLESIQEQGKLTPELKAKILAAATKQALEDLYLPYRPKRRTRAMIAKEMGLEPLAHAIFRDNLADAQLEAEVAALVAAYNANPPPGEENAKLPQSITAEQAWAGCRDIYAETVADDAETRELVRHFTFQNGALASTAAKDFAGKATKFNDYYDFSEPVAKIPPHRYLALNRGEREKVLRVRVVVDEAQILEKLGRKWASHAKGRPLLEWSLALADGYQRLIAPAVEVDVRMALKEQADGSSIVMFCENLRNLLLSPPGGHQVVLGLDPGLRTGTKWVVISQTGALLDNGTIYPLPPKKDVTGSEHVLLAAIARHNAQMIVVGNGTGSREALAFAKSMVEGHQLPIPALMVSEAGASVYSASDEARREFPELDVSIRGAVSIARRYQDPLAELVKIEPKSIGVGQYQHDVNQSKLKRSLDETVESCVNYVGVDLNTASPALLQYVSGIGPTLARAIVQYRDGMGAFTTRAQLEKVPGLGPKAFQQCAGFLRIPGGPNPLDNSAVHPERYAIVQKMAADLSVELAELLANEKALAGLKLETYLSDELGMPTLQDILSELKKPGRDPRADHKNIEFNDAVTEMEHLREGMELNGVVTNVTHFGAFVDVGVHQDGLVHVSELSDTFVKDPAQVVRVGQPVKVTVKEIDLERRRIALSMRTAQGKKSGPAPKGERPAKQEGPAPRNPEPVRQHLPLPSEVLGQGPLTSQTMEQALAMLSSKFKG